MDLQNFIVGKFPDDGALVPKHVAISTSYEVCVFCGMLYCNLNGATSCFFKRKIIFDKVTRRGRPSARVLYT